MSLFKIIAIYMAHSFINICLNLIQYLVMYLTVSIRDELFIFLQTVDIHLLQTIYNVIRLVIITLHADGMKHYEQNKRPRLGNKINDAYGNYSNQT